MYIHIYTCSPTKRKLTKSVSVIGTTKYASAEDTIVQIVKARFSFDGDTVEVYPKAVVSNQIISSKFATRMKRHNDSTVLYTDPDIPNKIQYGRVEAFVVVPQDSLHLAIVHPLAVSRCCEEQLDLCIPEEMAGLSSFCFNDFVIPSRDPQPTVAISIEHIVAKCFDSSTTCFSGLITLVNEKEISR